MLIFYLLGCAMLLRVYWHYTYFPQNPNLSRNETIDDKNIRTDLYLLKVLLNGKYSIKLLTMQKITNNVLW